MRVYADIEPAAERGSAAGPHYITQCRMLVPGCPLWYVDAFFYCFLHIARVLADTYSAAEQLPWIDAVWRTGPWLSAVVCA